MMIRLYASVPWEVNPLPGQGLLPRRREMALLLMGRMPMLRLRSV